MPKIKKKRILRGPAHKLCDCHLHATNFIQEKGSFKNLIKQMDRANIEKTVVFGMPVKKIFSEREKTPPKYYLDNDSKCQYYHDTDDLIAEEYEKLSKKDQKRIIPFLCGFNPMDRGNLKIIERKLKRYKGIFKGVGEILLRHDDLTLMTLGETPRCNSVAMHNLAEFCREHDLPLMIHQNITSIGFGTHPEFLPELKELLSKHPKTTFIWVHCGISRRVLIPNYSRLVTNLMNFYRNLYVDYSWVVYDDVITDDEGEPKKKWIDLTEKFSERILLGSDLVLQFELIGPTMRRYDPLLKKLSKKARENICRKNCERLFS